MTRSWAAALGGPLAHLAGRKERTGIDRQGHDHSVFQSSRVPATACLDVSVNSLVSPQSHPEREIESHSGSPLRTRLAHVRDGKRGRDMLHVNSGELGSCPHEPIDPKKVKP
jgi:hypothetical protein